MYMFTHRCRRYARLRRAPPRKDSTSSGPTIGLKRGRMVWSELSPGLRQLLWNEFNDIRSSTQKRSGARTRDRLRMLINDIGWVREPEDLFSIWEVFARNLRDKKCPGLTLAKTMSRTHGHGAYDTYIQLFNARLNCIHGINQHMTVVATLQQQKIFLDQQIKSLNMSNKSI